MKIGVDLGGTNTVVGLCTDEGALLCKQGTPTRTGDPDGLRADMRRLALAVCAEKGVAPDEVCQVGIGVPGSFIKRTCTLTFGTNLQMDDVSFAQAFQPEFNCPVYLDNDANCAALGEYIGGAGRGVRNMVMVTLGTGLGGGLILDGKLYTGANDIAGEIGHMVVHYNGLPCNCGRRGCWEAYSSATGMVRLAEAALAQGGDSLLRGMKAENGGRLMAKMVCDARDAGDSLADGVFQQYVEYFACGLNNMIAILQPEKIVVGGGLAGYGEKLMSPVRALVRRGLMKADCEQAELVLAELGNDAGIIGAAMLAR
ncbi:ROK family protein [Intestinibacillus massiliensis]|nr:ROK family protein [Intestinibacillus massiliensis]